MDVLERKMRKKLSGKRYLLALDDVWNLKTEVWNNRRAIALYEDQRRMVIYPRQQVLGIIWRLSSFTCIEVKLQIFAVTFEAMLRLLFVISEGFMI